VKKLLMVGRTRYQLPLNDTLRAKFDALRKVFDLRVLASRAPGAPAGDETFELGGPWRPRRLDGRLYFATLPFRTAKELRRSRPDAVLVQGAHETWLVLQGRRLARSRAPVVLDIHGDWRSSTRLYGSPARRLLNPLADRVAVSAVRHADAVRTISDYTTGLVRSYGVEPAAVFPAFMDLDPFLGPVQPLPSPPRALFVGVLEHYKGIEELAAAWRDVSARLPGVVLHLVGKGTQRAVAEQLVRDLPGRVEWTESLPTEGVAAAPRRGHGAPASIALGGNGPRARRGVLPGARGGRLERRRHRRPRPRRREWAACPAGGSRCASGRDVPRAHGSRPRRAARRGARQSAEAWVASPRSTRPAWKRSSPHYDRSMRADRIKQSLKNGVYRALGETATGVGALNGDEARTLRVLMYHKINDVPENSVTVPVGRFDEQMAQIGELGYTPVALDAVIDYYLHGTPLPPQAVLITFDDGYRDNLRNAAPVLQRYGYPPSSSSRSATSPARGRSRTTSTWPHAGIVNPPLHWEELAELESYGVRVESHGIGHRPLADLEVDEAAREITLSKLRLEERLGRPVRAFAYVKGSEAHYRLVHLSLLKQAGYDVAFTSVSGSNGPATDPLQLHRYNVEPYPSRTFELVLAGACDLIAVKDTVAGTHARRIFNAALGTSTK
jgi:peptidoglycan/xylan/chitin deacetylase (PgdA/CDA1 family)